MMIITPKSSRVITSKTSDRTSGDSVCPARNHTPGALSDMGASSRSSNTSSVRVRDPTRERRKISDATPVAAMTSTAISPRVSQARVSTSATLTMFLP